MSRIFSQSQSCAEKIFSAHDCDESPPPIRITPPEFRITPPPIRIGGGVILNSGGVIRIGGGDSSQSCAEKIFSAHDCDWEKILDTQSPFTVDIGPDGSYEYTGLTQKMHDCYAFSMSILCTHETYL